ncbi:hypothetical protein ACUOFC_66385, partial [Escherichia sp. TWPC-MK]
QSQLQQDARFLRVLLQLALTQTKDPQQIQQIFNQY